MLGFDLVLTGGDRVAELSRFFRSLASQSRPVVARVLFVNQAETSVSFAGTGPAGLSVRELHVGHRLPLSVARNRALPLVEEDIIGFPDDDCWYPPELLGRVAETFEREPGLDALCVRVFDPDANLAYGRRPAGVERAVTFWNLFRYPISVGLFVRRRALEAAGMWFDETLGAGAPIGSGEESDLVARLLESGAQIRYAGDIQVFHPVVGYVPSDVGKYVKYGYGFGFLNGRLVRRGHLAVVPHYLEVVARSAAGALFHVRDPVRRGVYLARLRGMIAGFAGAVIGRSPGERGT